MAFLPRSESALDTLSDDALIAYLREARAAEDPSASTALAVLVYGHWDNVRRRVALKVPAAWVEDVSSEVLVSAIQSAFDGVSEGEFRVWLHTITARRIADFHRRSTAAAALEDYVGEAPSETGSVEVQDAIDRVLARLRPEHREAVRIVVFEDRPAGEVPGLSTANVHQIVSRFRRALSEELDTG